MTVIKNIAICVTALLLYAGPAHADLVGTFVLDHFVPSISHFHVQHYHPRVQKGVNVLGKLVVQNNLLDGFTVYVKSENNGVLHTSSMSGGESDIPYQLSATKVMGHLGDGIVEVSNMTTDINLSNSSTNPVEFLSGSQVSPTDISYKITAVIPDIGNQLNMAGQYSDTITFTYTDE